MRQRKVPTFAQRMHASKSARWRQPRRRPEKRGGGSGASTRLPKGVAAWEERLPPGEVYVLLLFLCCPNFLIWRFLVCSLTRIRRVKTIIPVANPDSKFWAPAPSTRHPGTRHQAPAPGTKQAAPETPLPILIPIPMKYRYRNRDRDRCR